MFGKLSSNSRFKKILIVSLSNLGDVVLTCPVIDILLRDFPWAHVSVIVGPKGDSLFDAHPRIQVIHYDKHWPWLEQLKWFWQLSQQGFDVVIDLRQTALGIFLPCRWHTPYIPLPFEGHLQLKHLARLRSLYPCFIECKDRLAIIPKPWQGAIKTKKYVVIAPGAADSAKRWHPAGFIQVADALARKGYEIVFVGSQGDTGLIEEIRQLMTLPSVSLAGATDLRQLAFILTGATFVIAHDSGVMHMASYFNVPIIVLWGPTPVELARPWSSKSQIVYRQGKMSLIRVEDVLNAVDQME